MKFKDTVIVVLAFALAVVSYLLGYRSGQLRDFELRAARARLNAHLILYDKAQRGDLQQVRSDLGLMLSGMTQTFAREFGAPEGTNAFAQRFARAQAISEQVEKTLVPASSIISELNKPDKK